VEDGVLADPDTDDESVAALQPQAQRRLRNARRQVSPEGKQKSSRTRQDEAEEMVNRQPDGSFLLNGRELSEALPNVMYAPEILKEQENAGELGTRRKVLRGSLTTYVEQEAEYTEQARAYFTSGAALKTTKKQDEGVSIPPSHPLRERR
jgi:hypothetical protein